MKDVLLLHGALGSSKFFKENIKSSNFNFQTIDFPGHGDSSLTTSFSIESFAESVIKFLNKNNLDKTDVFGYSMGGYVALYLSLFQPERIGKIFTLGTKFLWTENYAQNETKKLNAEKIIEKVPVFAEQLKRRHTANNWIEVLENTAGMMKNLGEKPLITLENLTQLKQKIRIGIGDKDNTVSVDEAFAVHKVIPGSELEVFPNTQHPIERVNLSRLTFSIEEFFSEN